MPDHRPTPEQRAEWRLDAESGPACAEHDRRILALLDALEEAEAKALKWAELERESQNTAGNLGRMLAEAEAACTAKDAALRHIRWEDCPWCHAGSYEHTEKCLLSAALVSSPGRDLLNELARLRDENARLTADLAGQVAYTERECARLREEILRLQNYQTERVAKDGRALAIDPSKETARSRCEGCRLRDEALSALTPDKARTLADWIDWKHPGDKNPEVQRDLRRYADLARDALTHPKESDA